MGEAHRKCGAQFLKALEVRNNYCLLVKTLQVFGRNIMSMLERPMKANPYRHAELG